MFTRWMLYHYQNWFLSYNIQLWELNFPLLIDLYWRASVTDRSIYHNRLNCLIYYITLKTAAVFASVYVGVVFAVYNNSAMNCHA